MKSIKTQLILIALSLTACLQVKASTNLVNGFYVISNAPQSITLAWDLESDPSVVGYNVYEGPSFGNYNTIFHAGLTNALPIALQFGQTYFFAATAIDAQGHESNFSTNVVTWTTPKIPASPVTHQPTILTVQVKHDAIDFMWTDAGISWMWDPADTNSIFRLAITKGPLIASAAKTARAIPALPPLPGQ